jgi:hypothetical protein
MNQLARLSIEERDYTLLPAGPYKMNSLDEATGIGALGPTITLCLLDVKGLPRSIVGCLIFTKMKG